jgi:hypothetical protein
MVYRDKDTGDRRILGLIIWFYLLVCFVFGTICAQSCGQVVRMQNHGDSGHSSMFSGVVVSVDKEGSDIVSVAHGIEGDGPTLVKVDDEWLECKLKKDLWKWDLVLLRSKHKFPKPIKLGESLDVGKETKTIGWTYHAKYIKGLPGIQGFSDVKVTLMGRVQKVSGGWVFLTGEARSGMSGGAILQDGKLFGIISAKQPGQCKAIGVWKVKAMLE